MTLPKNVLNTGAPSLSSAQRGSFQRLLNIYDSSSSQTEACNLQTCNHLTFFNVSQRGSENGQKPKEGEQLTVWK